MPPFVPRKRRKSASPAASPESRPKRKAPKRKDYNYDTSVDDIDSLRPGSVATAAETKKYLESLDENDGSSKSDLSDEEFEDVLPADTGPAAEEDDSDEEKWEDVLQTEKPRQDDPPLKDLELTISQPEPPSFLSAISKNGKKGPTKIERHIRINTHCMHVLCLMWANTIRNSWLNDRELHKILLDQLSDGMKREIDRWRTASGLDIPDKKSVRGSKAKGKTSDKSGRSKDWSSEASRLEPGVPDMSAGDPLLKLLRHLVSFWKKRFTVTSPPLRKQGYRTVRERDAELRAFRIDRSISSIFGEKIDSIEEFRSLARKGEGSPDVGAHLFTALLRSIGIETRMVASLQPAGFGWSQAEEAKKLDLDILKDIVKAGSSTSEPIEISGDDSDSETFNGTQSKATVSSKSSVSTPTLQSTIIAGDTVKVNTFTTGKGKRNDKAITSQRPGPASSSKLPKKITTQTHGNSVIGQSESSSELSEVLSSDLDSDIDMTGVQTTRKAGNKTNKSGKILPYQTYWSEVLSPVTNIYVPVSIFTTPSIAFKPEFLTTFEPRGGAADKAKQVICYVVAHSRDGTAKDVTVRYLKRHQLPGRTKGFRLQPEKVPIYNKNGRVIKHIEIDWFDRVMTFYARPNQKRTVADDIEDQGDLVPLKASKATTEDSTPETLQGYKNSIEFVLERHLRREEALLPSAKVVRYFTAGKGDKAKKEPVYLRKDVVTCKTAESWHKEGREIRMGEQPLKQVPIRAVTLLRKLEVEEATRNTGEKPLQRLYSREQTDWIIPPPIKDGKIPKNAYGNIDVYVPSMIPKGAVHIPYQGLARVCKKLEIDYAVACTGFEFGHQMAVPILTGVVIAEEYEEIVIDAWREEEERKRKKEEEKLRNETLTLWRKFANGLRIIERVKKEYGELDTTASATKILSTTSNQKKGQAHPLQVAANKIVDISDEDEEHLKSDDENDDHLGGGFIPEDSITEETSTIHIDIDDQEHSHNQNSIISKAKGRNKAAPRSLRSTLPSHGETSSQHKTSDPKHSRPLTSSGNSVIEATDDEAKHEGSGKSDESNESHEDEYIDFKQRKKGRRTTRKTGKTSPYFKKTR
jgi:xeroderma pigmentosum group C-complementing protein